MGMSMYDADDFQTQVSDRGHDTRGISARVENVTGSSFGIAQHGAIALQGADRERFSHKVHGWFISRLVLGVSLSCPGQVGVEASYFTLQLGQGLKQQPCRQRQQDNTEQAFEPDCIAF